MDNLNYNGKIKVFEQNIKVLPRRELPKLRQKIGVVVQDPNLLDHLTILQNVMLPLFIAGHNESAARTRAHKILSWIGLGEWIEQYPPTLSGGQKQTAVLARALVTNPEILIADEPTGNLDLKNAKRLMQIFEYLHQQGTTILMATHNQNLVKEFPHPELRLIHKRLEFITHTMPSLGNNEEKMKASEQKIINADFVNNSRSTEEQNEMPQAKGESNQTKAPSKYSSFYNVIKP